MVKLNQSGLLFVPSRWQRGRAVRWLKRIHAWTGFWGAVLFFMLGVSGALLNHRSIWKIDTGEPVEVSAMNIKVAPDAIDNEKALGKWAVTEFGLLTDPKPPRKEGGDTKSKRPEKTQASERFMGKDRIAAEKWELVFNQPNGKLTVEYVKGAASVAVRQDAQNALGVLKNLHKGNGVGLGWILFMDSIAGALIAMSLTGFLLWSRLHGGRLLGGGLLMGSVVAGTILVWPFLL